MDLSTYQELTGLTVSSQKSQYVTAQIKRCLSMLEVMLGFTLDPELVETNLYNELGKSRDDCACPSAATQDDADLDDPDAVVGAYRLFPYNHLDQFLHIDPFTRIHKVKLVYVKQGSAEDNGVTIKTFDTEQVRVNIGRDGIGKYVEICKDCFCDCECSECVQLAVDADWLWPEGVELPLDLQYVLADMVQYYSDKSRNVKSESITTHSYTKFEKIRPEDEPANKAVISRYAGPHGSATVQPTQGAAGRRVHSWL